MRRQLAAALLGAALLTGGAQAVAEPTAARYVADEADVLSSETEQYIIDKTSLSLRTPAARSWWCRWILWTAWMPPTTPWPWRRAGAASVTRA